VQHEFSDNSFHQRGEIPPGEIVKFSAYPVHVALDFWAILYSGGKHENRMANTSQIFGQAVGPGCA